MSGTQFISFYIQDVCSSTAVEFGSNIPRIIIPSLVSQEWQCQWCAQTNGVTDLHCPHCGAPRDPLR